MPGESRANPLHMKIVSDAGISKLVTVALLSLAPVAVAILMQNPALRQQLQMRTWLFVRQFSHESAKKWRQLEVIADHHYDLARL